MNTVIAVFLVVYCLLWAMALHSSSAANLFRYINMLIHGFAHMVFTRETASKRPIDAAHIDGKQKKAKTVVFVRHGESVWNEVFNRGFGPSFLVRLGTALLREIPAALSMDSVFFDTPLSEFGGSQAVDLVCFLRNKDAHTALGEEERRIVSMLNGTFQEPVALVVSNLRRAIMTAVIVTWDRIKKTGERLIVLASLQEISRNVDTQSVLLEKQEMPHYSFDVVESKNDAPFNPKDFLDCDQYSGNKSIFGDGLARQREFCRWVMQRPEDTIIVAGGHSLWFRSFFRNFLPRSSTHTSKTSKMVNCGVVSLQLEQGIFDSIDQYRINPNSIKTVYGGFVIKSSKKD